MKFQDIKKKDGHEPETAKKGEDFFRNYRREPAVPERKIEKPLKKQRSARRSFSRGKIIFTILVLIFLGIILTKTMNALSRVTVLIKPHEETIKIDAVFKAARSGSADLSFQTMELKLNKEKSVNATGVKMMETKASGQIVIYNTYSSATQLLVQNTRFESPTGKIYRLNKSVTVPGTKTQNGQVIPGSIEVTIFADKPGEEYNSNPTDFTIPGFKDSPRYDKFYGRSKTPLAGGFKGNIPVITDGDYNKIKEDLKNVLTEELIGKARTQKLTDFILLEKAAKIEFTEKNSDPSATTSEFTIQINGVFSVPLVPKKELAKILAKKYISNDAADKVEIKNIDSLKFEVSGMDETDQTFNLNIKGDAHFIWLLDEERLKEALIASSRNLNTAFKDYPAVEKASVIFKPSWWKFFPTKKSRITVQQSL